jgi:ferredoxin
MLSGANTKSAPGKAFDCVGCNICASSCPAQISHSAVGLLARRLPADTLTRNAPIWKRESPKLKTVLTDEPDQTEKDAFSRTAKTLQ